MDSFTFKSAGLNATEKQGPCCVCGEYGCWIIGLFGGDREWACEKHKDEYLYGNTDWWALIRLVREASDS